ncbi:MAG: lamin tail domain-containing protein [Candidatus Delongbacteria bacterium]
MKTGLTLAALITAGPLFAAVVINEIHYNPDPGADTSYEFFELHNTGAVDADLGGWAVTSGVVHSFAAGTSIPAGGYLVVAKLASTYTGAPYHLTNVVQWTSGDLNNGGETLTLSDASAGVVDTVPYDDGGCWPLDPDGQGPSLELLDPAQDNSLCTSWAASTGVDYGTPGAQNSVFAGGGSAPVISGVAHSPVAPSFLDAVTVSATVTDDTGLALVQLEVAVDGNPSQLLAMSNQGGDLFTVLIPAQAAGAVVAYRVLAQDDNAETTLGDWQGYTVAAGTVEILINELHYNGLAAGTDVDEFIELFNHGTATVDLGGWSLSGVTFTFPAGSFIAPGEYRVLAVNSEAFAARYGFLPDFQWTSGALSNDGEAIVLSNASAQEMDRVVYDDASPWPTTPDGSGPSLELIAPALDNSLAANWQASFVDGGTPRGPNSTAPVVEAIDAPRGFALAPAWPNPFNPSTTLAFTLEQAQVVELAVFDLAGRRVAVLAQGLRSAGTHQVVFQAEGLASGLYLARLQGEGRLECQRLVLVK